jgi:hypothetical protein
VLRCNDGNITTHDVVGTKKIGFFLFFFLNDSWQVQESSTSSSMHDKERKRERVKERESFET